MCIKTNCIANVFLKFLGFGELTNSKNHFLNFQALSLLIFKAPIRGRLNDHKLSIVRNSTEIQTKNLDKKYDVLVRSLELEATPSRYHK